MVSVIIPTYNLAGYVEACIDSVCSQTYEDLEIIIVDDGSSDHTVKIIRFYQEKDARIKLIVQSNGGAAKARNTGLDNATGEYVMFVDGDDMISPDTISKNIAYLISDETIDWVAFSIVRVNKDKVPINAAGIYGNLEFKQIERVRSKQFVPYFYERKISGVCCGAIYRVESMKQIRFSEGDFYEDGFFFTDLMTYTNIGILSPFGKYYYVHRLGSSQLKRLDYARLRSDLRCYSKRLKQLRDKFPEYEYIYEEWENKRYHFYKNEMSKGTEGAKKIFNEFMKNIKHKPKLDFKKELKYLIYRLWGYKNLKYLLRKCKLTN